MEDLINKFLTPSFGSGSGSGYGYYSGDGDGSGSGCGDGDGSGSGWGYSDGSGDGYGSGSGDGYGYDSGSGDGSGSDSGSGDGYGSGSGHDYGDGVLKYSGQTVCLIDRMPTIIESVKGNYAKGYTIQRDLTLKPCYIAKVGDFFAHGATLQDAIKDAQIKHDTNLPEEERIQMFVKEFKSKGLYPAKLFFDWHNILTGSCEYGRKDFCRVNNIDIENDMMTVKEFLSLTKNAYGRDIIEKLIQLYR